MCLGGDHGGGLGLSVVRPRAAAGTSPGYLLPMRRNLKRVALALLLPAGLYLVAVAVRRPSLERVWDEDVRVLAGVEVLPDSAIRLTRVRDWRYTRDSVTAKPYFDGIYDPRDIVGLWMYEQELDGVGLIAHTFVVFEFDESYGEARWLGLSVETRRELGETYSLLGGMLRSFEVTHIWATERDLVTRRVEFLDYPLRRYRVVVPPEVRARVFVKFAQETAELAVTPRWYNTVASNCTSALIRYVNESEPGAIPFHYSYALTGRADDHLARLGYLDGASATDVTREFLAENPLR